MYVAQSWKFFQDGTKIYRWPPKQRLKTFLGLIGNRKENRQHGYDLKDLKVISNSVSKIIYIVHKQPESTSSFVNLLLHRS